MFGAGVKPSLGLSISTSAANATGSTGAPASQPAGGSLFGGFASTSKAAEPASSQGAGLLFGGAAAASKPGQSGGLFGTSTSQPAAGSLFGSTATTQPVAGGLFGATTSQPAAGGLFAAAKPAQPAAGGLLGSTASQPPVGTSLGTQPAQPAAGGLFGTAATSQSAAGGLFAPASSQPATGGLFGTSATQPAQSAQPAGGLFGTASSQPAQAGGLFGLGTTQQPAASGLFGAPKSQPAASGGLFGSASQPATTGGLFGMSAGQPTLGTGLPGDSSQKPAQGGGLFGNSISQGSKPAPFSGQGPTAKIDLDHLRPTTRFDQLTDELQKEILNLDTMILGEMTRCDEVANLLPAIATSGANIPNDVDYVTQKLEEVDTGLENDAVDIQSLKEETIKQDASEAKLCFREVDRLRMPSQYQSSITGPATSLHSSVYAGHGLSGWWNHPQSLQRSIRGGAAVGGSRSFELPAEEEDALSGAPASLVAFFDRKADAMKKSLAEKESLLTEIEAFVGSVENKIAVKQLQLRRVDGMPPGMHGEGDQLGLLRYVFGEFERSLYDVAGKVGGARDGVQELVMATGESRAGRLGR